MLLANFQRNILVSVREENFRICRERRWLIEEKGVGIYLYDENKKIIGKFFGHVLLSKFLGKENSK